MTLAKSASENLALIQQTYDEHSINKSRVFEQHSWFKERWEDVHEDWNLACQVDYPAQPPYLPNHFYPLAVGTSKQSLNVATDGMNFGRVCLVAQIRLVCGRIIFTVLWFKLLYFMHG